MSKDKEFEVPEDCMLKDDAEEMATNRSALAINEFLAHLALGSAPSVAFEWAVDGDTIHMLNTPSNLRIEVLP